MEKITKEYFKIAVRNLRTRRLRSWLTILGIVIGVFLVISLLSLGEGIKSAMLKQLRALGGDVIFIMPGAEDNPLMGFIGGGELTKEDIKTIEKVNGVDIVLPMAYKSKVIRYENEGKTVFVSGIPFDKGMEILKDFQGWSLAEGNWPKPGRREILIGYAVAEKDFFKKEVKVGKELIISGKRFKISGILNSLGNKMDDSQVYLGWDIYQDLTGEKEGNAQMIMAKIETGASVEEVAEEIKKELDEIRKRKRGKDVSDVSVITSEKVTGIVGSIMGIIQIAVMALASIAIVVGGIGIMNTMFTAVRERTKEIGILKAIGAKNSTIAVIFLIESGIIGLIGGIGGVIVGLGLAKGIEFYIQLHPVFYLEAYISPLLIIFGLVFSFLIGCLSGYLPARRAAKLKPVDALRYE